MNFSPALFKDLRNYSKKKFISDLIAGIVVGIIAIPLSIAFAIASGATPVQGLFTGAIAGLIIGIFGGSSFNVSGPTGAFVIIIYGIIEKYGYSGLVTATIMAGILLVALGFFKLGKLIRFIPRPITVGFTAGIAVIIFAGQIKDFLGLTIENLPSEFFEKIKVLYQNLHTMNYHSLSIGLLCIVFIYIWNKKIKKFPASVIVLVIATLAVAIFKLPVETIGSKFGDLSAKLPAPIIPHIDFEVISALFLPALSIALLGGIESLLSAVVADSMTGKKHDSNTELIGQGIGNIVSGVFGLLPATGAIARTAANIKNGGKTPVSAIIHAITITLCTIFFMNYVKLIPMTALSAILFMVCFGMVEIKAIKQIFKSPRSDIVILIITFAITISMDLIYAIMIGVLLAAVLFMKDMADEANIKEEKIDDLYIVRVVGAMFFAQLDDVSEVFDRAIESQSIILDFNDTQYIDAASLAMLLQFYKRCKKEGVELILKDVDNNQPLRALKKIGLYDKLPITSESDYIMGFKA